MVFTNTDAPYTILDGATAIGTLTMNQRQEPAGFVDDGVAREDLGLYLITGDTLVVRLSDLVGPPGRYEIADAVRVEPVGD